MGMVVHVAQGTARLADGLAGLVASPLPDPFAEELVVVPAKGVERWLTQRLSHRLGVGPRGGDGVCAGIRFVNPRSLVATLTGTDGTDPWDPDRLVWPLLEELDASLGQPWCRALSSHLGHGVAGEEGDLRRDRRWSVARRLAGLFCAYAVQRPRLVADWSAGRDRDGAGMPLDDDLTWQAELWRRVTGRVPAPTPQERQRATLAAIRSGEPLALPDRLSLFGHTRLPVTEIELLAAVAEVRQVHLWLPTPSPALWSRLADAVAVGTVARDADASAEQVRHPLLVSLGRDSRELQRSLTALGDTRVEVAAGADHPSTLLGWLQVDLSSDAPPDAATRSARVRHPDDASVQVHATHGMARQVEVLREVLAGLCQDDPTMEPRDVLVMCPDIDAWAPHFSAGFGLGGVVHGGHPAHDLRVRLADRGLAATNPFLAVAAQLVAITGGRATLTEVLDLAAAPPVRYRFRFSDDDLATVSTWSTQAGVRWGLNGRLRAAYRLEDFAQNTWRAGLDRLLLGVAMSEDEERAFGEVLPLDDVGSAAVDLAGRFAELVGRVEACVESLRAEAVVSDWLRTLTDGVLSLAAASSQDAWQVTQFERELAEVAAASSASGSSTERRLRLADWRALLEQRTGGRPTRANFRTGALTVCTMVPMRSVPHRVICLVGLDDGVFPRTAATDGDDVLARRPLTGERDVRSEDRQLLLDAVLAAGERLVLTYTGADDHTGQERPPSVPLGELLDALDVTSSAPVRDDVVVRHPLQPFDARNVTPGALVGSAAFSFDRTALRGARAAAGTRHPPGPFLPVPLPPLPPGDLALADLQSFLAHPARRFLRGRLDVAVSFSVDEPADAMPVELDALTAWGVGDRVLRRVLDGTPLGAALDAERRRGALPPGTLGQRVLEDIARKAKALLDVSAPVLAEPSRRVDLALDLGDGRRLVGVVPGLRAERIVRVQYSSLGPKHRLAAWVDLLALATAEPDREWTAWTFGWLSAAGRPQRSVLGPLQVGPRELLEELVDVYDRGMREPLPIPLRTAHTWAQSARRDGGPDRAKASAGEWESAETSVVPGEQDEREHVLLHGPKAGFADMAGHPRPDERWNDESTRLGRYAVRIWEPLMDHEAVRPL